MKIRRWGDVKLDLHERAPRAARGIEHLEGDIFNNNTIEARADRWVSTLENLGLISSPSGRFSIMRGAPAEEHGKTMIIAGRNTIDKIEVFTCTFCPKPTTENPGKHMRGVWPPPANWTGAEVKPDKVPRKLKKYKWELLVCDECSKHAETVLEAKAAKGASDESPPVQD